MASAYSGVTSAMAKATEDPSKCLLQWVTVRPAFQRPWLWALRCYIATNGKGQHIDCSLLDTYVQMHEELILASVFAAKRQFPAFRVSAL